MAMVSAPTTNLKEALPVDAAAKAAEAAKNPPGGCGL
jgi:hypothetical protein